MSFDTLYNMFKEDRPVWRPPSEVEHHLRKPVPPEPPEWWEILLLLSLVVLGSWLFAVIINAVLD